jgi:outer membrane immunogenic protein
MKEFLRVSIALATLAAFMDSAHAGFLDPSPAYPVPAPATYPVKSAVPAPVFDWTGFYVGINGGGSWGRVPWSSDPDATSGTATTSSGLIGGTIGYNAQNLGPFVFGEEFDFDWRSINATIPAPFACSAAGTLPTANCEFKSDWLATARLRFGYAVDRFLPYVTAGVSMADITQGIAGEALGSANSVSFNWTAGAGLEFVVSGPLTAKLEYLYVNHTNTGCNAECGGVQSGGLVHMGLNENIFRVGLDYRLWSR